MKIKIQMPQQGISANVVAKDPAGNPIEIGSLEIEPFFFRKDERPAVLFGEVTHDGKSLDRIVLTVSGTNGKATLLHRTDPVKPAIATKKDDKKSEQKDDRKPSPKPANSGDVSDDIPSTV